MAKKEWGALFQIPLIAVGVPNEMANRGQDGRKLDLQEAAWELKSF